MSTLPPTDCSAILKFALTALALPTLFRLARFILTFIYNFYVFKLKPRPRMLSPEHMGKWAVITGSTDGIGFEYARQLGKIGFSLVLISRSDERLKASSDRIRSECPAIEIVTLKVDFADVTADDYVRISEELFSKIKGEHEVVDIGILVNNVGVSYERLQAFEEISHSAITQMIDVNVASTINMSRMVLPHMLRSCGKRALIINISSSSAYLNMPYLTAYTACKAAVISFSKALQLELENTKVDVQCIYPGLVATKMIAGATPGKKLRPRWHIPSAEDFVRAALNSVGSLSFSSGCFPHFLYIEIAHDFVPNAVFLRNIRKALARLDKKAKEKEANQSVKKDE